MTNRVALWLGVTICAALAVDALFGLRVTLFIAREFLGFLDWLAFWR
jgi:hypothetical protein